MRERVNYVKQKRAAGQTAIGATIQLASPECVEILGAAGYDFAWIDCEHGSFYLEKATEMIRAADASGTTAVVRVPNQEPTYIARILDAGALGIMVPNVSDKAEAAVAAAKYRDDRFPFGRRGACPGTRAAWHQSRNWVEFVRWSNENTMVWPLIESPEGFDNFEKIVEVPGIDAVVMGPFDLAHAMGYPGQTRHPEVTARIAGMVKTALSRKVDVVAVLFSADPGEMKKEKEHWAAQGVQIMSVGSDRRVLTTAMNERIRTLRDV